MTVSTRAPGIKNIKIVEFSRTATTDSGLNKIERALYIYTYT
jgi:hypothetical protein